MSLDDRLRELEARSHREDALREWERRQPVRNLPPCMYCGTTKVRRQWGIVMPTPDGMGEVKLNPYCDDCERSFLAQGFLSPPTLLEHERRDVPCAS